MLAILPCELRGTVWCMDSREKLLAGLAMAMGVGLLYLAHKNSPKVAVSSGDRVLVAGDSLGVGLQDRLKALAAAEGIALEGISVGGSAIFQWARQSSSMAGHSLGTEVILANRPSVVLLSLGTNDSAMGDAGIEGERDDLEKLVSRLCDAGVRVVWLLPPDDVAFPRVGQVKAMIRGSQAASRCGMVFIEPPPGTLDGSYDGIHPRAAGYDLWARYIWQKVRGR